MKARWLVSVLLFLALSSGVSANGLVTISGKLVSITEKSYVVETKFAKYSINREAVSPQQAQELAKKAEAQVAIAVPFEAVVAVRSKHRK